MGFLDRFRRGGSETSASGQPIHRHTRAAKPKLSGGDEGLIQAVVAHIEQHVGEPEHVWHQMVSPYVHVDIHIVPPSEERPYVTLVTSGMSERPMQAPEESVSRAELVMALPPDWSMGPEAFSDEDNYWPFRLLQMLAALPHEYETWLWWGHTVPNGDPAEPYAPGTELCGAILLEPPIVSDGFLVLEHEGQKVTFLGVYPLHADEMQLKLDTGAEALVERLDAADHLTVIDPARPSVAGS